MSDLPADLADPLHILEPVDWPWKTLLLALLLTWLLWRWWRGRSSPKAPLSRPTAPRQRSQELSGLGRVLRDIRQSALAIGDYRRGCHDLAIALRAHQEERSGQPYTRLTAREILALGEIAIGNFFDLLGDLQFGQMPPSRSDFEGIVNLAQDVFILQSRPRKKGQG